MNTNAKISVVVPSASPVHQKGVGHPSASPDETLGSLLRDDNNNDSGEIAQHVESCEQCQTRLGTITQDGLTREEAGNLLRDDSLDDSIEIGRR